MAAAALQERLLSLVQDCLAKHLYSSASFFADKLVTLSGYDAAHVYLLAQAYFMGRQYRRALMLLRTTGLLEDDAHGRYLAARCLAEVHDWEECLTVLGGWDDDDTPAYDHQSAPASEELGSQISLYAAMCLLRGKVHTALDNQARAVTWYQAALKADPFCYEAFQILVEKQALTEAEERKLLSCLPLSENDQWLQLIYQAKGKKYSQQDTLEGTLDHLEAPWGDEQEEDAMLLSSAEEHPPGSSHPGHDRSSGEASSSHAMAELDARRDSFGWGLAGNLDVAVCRVEWLYHNGAFEDCYRASSAVMDRDPYALEVMPVHLAAAVELGRKNELFLRSHRLTEEYPDRAVAWYAVGCYYLAAAQYENARRYFGKATALDASFAPAWLGFGHAFAAQDESDQAMAAYRTAARRFPGLHQPLVGMGMEYARMNNLALAEQLLAAAVAVCPYDALLLQELGVLSFRMHNFAAAEHWLTSALDHMPGHLTSDRECALINLAHVYRKQKRWPEAVDTFEQALGLCPGQASTYAALAFTYHLQGKHAPAISNYHKAMGLRTDDALTAEMLTIALQEECKLEHDMSDDGALDMF